jgi:hypothetical protein
MSKQRSGRAGKSAVPPHDPEGKLRNAAGQEWDSARMDRISDARLDTLDLAHEIRQQAGELKGRHRSHPYGKTS